MKHSEHELACYSSALIYQKVKNWGLSDEQIFEGIEKYRHTCINPLEWTTSDVWNRFAENVEKACPHLETPLYTIGYEITTEQVSNFQLFFMRVASLPVIIKRIAMHVEQNISKCVKVEITFRGPGEGQISFTPKRRETYSTQICDFNRGCTHAILAMKGYRDIHVNEVQCAARGESSSCVYQFSWAARPSAIENIRNFFLFRLRNQKAIIRHMEENHAKLKEQYKEILSMRDFYSHMMQNMKESIVWLNDSGVIEFANDSFASLTGEPFSEITGKAFSRFTADEESGCRFEQAFCECRSRNTAQTVELDFHHPDGEMRVGRTTVKWVTSRHRSPGYIISIRDITESKKMEQKLWLAEDRYRALYENAPALIVGIDLKGHIIYANPAMVEQSEYSERELRDMHFGKLIAPDAGYDTTHLLDSLLYQPSRLQEVHFKTKSGHWKTIAFNSYQIFDDSGLGGIAGIGIDITETKRLNEQLIKTQRMELLGQLAGGLAHDFNNIMTAITGYAQIIRNQSPEDSTQRYSDVILGAACRASDLVKKLLSFSRGDEVELKEFDIREVVREAGTLINGSSPSCITVNIITPDEPLKICADPTKIHQCILNLGINARDAIGKLNSGAINLRLMHSPEDDQRVRIELEDSGKGISPDAIDRIFDPFFSTKEKKEGTGLGLSVVYGIIKAHQGTISVDSRPGEGTTFIIELPVNGAPEVSEDADRRVIVVAEDRVFRSYCLEILHSVGLRTKEFQCAKDALPWLSEHRGKHLCMLVDVSVADMLLPEFIESVRDGSSGIPVVLTSSQPEEKVNLTNSDFLRKPFSPAELVKAVKAVSPDAGALHTPSGS